MYPKNNNYKNNRQPFMNKKDDVPEIRSANVRLMDENKVLIGVMTKYAAQKTAEERGMDLIPLNATSEPAVCMLGDLNKFLYEQKKKAKELKKKNDALARATEEKEISFPADTTDSSKNDRERLMAQGNKFLAEGHPVKFGVYFKGRKMAHAEECLERITAELEANVTNGKKVSMDTSDRSDKRFLIKFMPVKKEGK